MSSTLFDAQPYDEAAARRRRFWIAGAILAAIAIAALLWFNRYWPEQRRVEHFFAELQAKNYEIRLRHLDERSQVETTSGKVHALWLPRVLPRLGSGRGMGYGAQITRSWRRKSRGPDASGVVIGVRVNQRKKLCSVRVEFKDKTLGFSPDEMVE